MEKRVISIVFNNFLHDSRVLKEAISLQNAGYEVTVVALHEDGLPERETMAGIDVHRIHLKTRKWSKNRIIQLFKYAELFYRIVKNYRNVDIFHCNDDGPLPMGVLTKWFFNRKLKVMYDAHELEFDKAEANSRYYPKAIQQLAEKLFIRHADAMTVVSPLIADAYVERYQIERPLVVMNCPEYADPTDKHDLFRQQFPIRKDQKIFLYQGGLIAKRGVELLIEVFSELPDDYVLIFLGFGPLLPLVEEAANNHPNIFFHPAVSPTELHPFTASSDFGFCLYQGITGNHQLTIGNKIFQYIMAGSPVLASDLQGLKYVLRPEMGIVVPNFRDKAAVQRAIMTLATFDPKVFLPVMQEAALEYNWEQQEKILLKAYQSLYE
jgi:glycosyltransferase involved in cell wall biosynthesis